MDVYLIVVDFLLRVFIIVIDPICCLVMLYRCNFISRSKPWWQWVSKYSLGNSKRKITVIGKIYVNVPESSMRENNIPVDIDDQLRYLFERDLVDVQLNLNRACCS